jgi:sterol desaturase/sphingolipid hydroxylase (fatty acid hydroxylase superfamily)
VIRRALYEFLPSPYAVFPVFPVFPVFLLCRAVLFGAIERLWPAQPVEYRRVVWWDLAAPVAYVYLIFPIAGYLNHVVHGYHSYATSVSHPPLPLRVALYFVVADFGHYWVHTG